MNLKVLSPQIRQVLPTYISLERLLYIDGYQYAVEALELFTLLADETRIWIVECLQSGEKCVCEIIPYVDRSQSTTSIQLKKLEDYGLLRSRRQGKKVFYKIVDYRVCEIFKIIGHNKEKVCHESCCIC